MLLPRSDSIGGTCEKIKQNLFDGKADISEDSEKENGYRREC